MTKVLIIDDSEFSLKAMYRVLRREYDVITVNNGHQGIATAISEKPDLILLDMMMPIIDGVEVFKILLSRDKTKSIPVIFVTSVNNPTMEAKCIEMGARDYVTKPITFELLLRRMENVLKYSERKP